MSFLALTTTQAVILGLLTAVAVVILFFLRLRQRRIVVGSSMLWQRVFDENQSASLIERLRRWISLALALLIALLIALSLGRPYPTVFGSVPRPVVIVLDTSLSLTARTSNGSTRWNRAVATARQILDGGSAAGGFMIIDTANRTHTLLTEDRIELDRTLERMRPVPGAQEFPEIPIPDADIYFVTDGVGEVRAPPTATILSVFEEADNAGIVAFEVQVDPTSPSGYTAYVEVANYSAAQKDVAFVLSGAGDRRVGQTLRIEAGASWRETFDLSEFQGGGLRVRIQTDGDALALDDTAFAYLPVRNDIRITLVTPAQGGYLETLLALSPRVELNTVRPDRYEDEPATDAYVFEGFAPPTRPSAPSLVFGGTGPEWLPRATGRVEEARITELDGDHPVMRFVTVHDLEVDEAFLLETGDWRTLARSRETALVAATEDPLRTVFVGFDPEASDFPLNPGFPIFVENVLAWFSGDTLARRQGLGTVAFPEEVERVTRLDGETVPLERRYGSTFIDAAEPELFTAVTGRHRFRVATNLSDRRISDVNRSPLDTTELSGDALAFGGGALWFYMLLAALLLVAAEWWTYNRRITL